MAAAIKLVDTVQGDAASLPEIVDYYCSNQFQVGVLFDRWAEVLRLPEPPDWYLASNWMLGTALLKLGDAAGAEAAFRSDLKHNIGHGRSLAGLEAALRKQGKTAEADATRKRFEYAWRGADISPAGL